LPYSLPQQKNNPTNLAVKIHSIHLQSKIVFQQAHSHSCIRDKPCAPAFTSKIPPSHRSKPFFSQPKLHLYMGDLVEVAAAEVRDDAGLDPRAGVQH
jgi:hypothetical protein